MSQSNDSITFGDALHFLAPRRASQVPVILEALSGDTPLGYLHLVQATSIPPTTLSRKLRGLTQEAIVTPKRVGNAVLFELTKKGRALLEHSRALSSKDQQPSAQRQPLSDREIEERFGDDDERAITRCGDRASAYPA